MIPPHVKHVTALPCEMLMSEKQILYQYNIRLRK